MRALLEQYSQFVINLDIRTKFFIAIATSMFTIVLNHFLSLGFAFLVSFFYVLAIKQYRVVVKSYGVMIVICILAVLFSNLLIISLNWGAKITFFQSYDLIGFANSLKKSLGWEILIPFSRMFIFINVLLVVSLTFENQHFIIAMQKMHLPRCIFLPMMVCCRFIPSFLTDLKQCHDSLKIRGFKFGLISSLFSLRMMMVPFCVRTLRLADNLVMSLELRGIGNKNKTTSMYELRMTYKDYWMLGLFLVVLISLVMVQYYMQGTIKMKVMGA